VSGGTPWSSTASARGLTNLGSPSAKIIQTPGMIYSNVVSSGTAERGRCQRKGAGSQDGESVPGPFGFLEWKCTPNSLSDEPGQAQFHPPPGGEAVLGGFAS
jgi:hypothetical protein